MSQVDWSNNTTNKTTLKYKITFRDNVRENDVPSDEEIISLLKTVINTHTDKITWDIKKKNK